MNDWPHSSTVFITFEVLGPEETKVHVEQTGIPSRDKTGNPIDENDVQQGWRQMIFQNIRDMLGYVIH
jgi:hypothetical protein